MSSPARSGERSGYRGEAASSRLAARSPGTRTAAELTRRHPTDPHREPDTTAEQDARAQWQADETPGLDEAHAIAGHPNYQTERTP